MRGINFGLIGKVTKVKRLKIKGIEGKTIINADIAKLKAAWQKPFKNW
jgi:hypothetical protein